MSTQSKQKPTRPQSQGLIIFSSRLSGTTFTCSVGKRPGSALTIHSPSWSAAESWGEDKAENKSEEEIEELLTKLDNKTFIDFP